MPEISSEKRQILDEINNIADQMREIASAIFAEPELGYQEFKSSARLADFLEANGFKVERGLLGMPTAFHAVYGSGEGPQVAYLAEFDALPGLGHACGHNLFGTASCGAAVALARQHRSCVRHARRGRQREGRRRQGSHGRCRTLRSHGRRHCRPCGGTHHSQAAAHFPRQPRNGLQGQGRPCRRCSRKGHQRHGRRRPRRRLGLNHLTFLRI